MIIYDIESYHHLSWVGASRTSLGPRPPHPGGLRPRLELSMMLVPGELLHDSSSVVFRSLLKYPDLWAPWQQHDRYSVCMMRYYVTDTMYY